MDTEVSYAEVLYLVVSWGGRSSGVVVRSVSEEAAAGVGGGIGGGTDDGRASPSTGDAN